MRYAAILATIFFTQAALAQDRTTEHLENFMSGWRSRITWQLQTDGTWVEIFDVAPPSKPWMNYMRITLTRTKDQTLS